MDESYQYTTLKCCTAKRQLEGAPGQIRDNLRIKINNDNNGLQSIE